MKVVLTGSSGRIGRATFSSIAPAHEVVGAENVNDKLVPVMGAEDFGWMLRERPGCYMFVGNGEGEGGGCHEQLHDLDVLSVPEMTFCRLALPEGREQGF